MKDIDFDELDKAVNSLMATSKPDSRQDDLPTTKPPTSITSPITPPVQAVRPAPMESAKPQVPSESTAVPVAVRPVVPAARRGGRFMDMVNTSGDARPRPVAAPAQPSREGLSITPRVDEPTPEQAAPSVAIQDTPAAQPHETFDDMPDPIDVQQIEPETTPAPPVITAQQPSAQVSQPDSPALGSLESPFLSDTKVEKRPLNSGSSDTPHETPADNYKSGETEVSTWHPTDDTVDEPPTVPQVAELDSDLVAIESDEKAETIQVVDSPDAVVQVPPPSTPLGAASIPQQYVAKPSTGDQSHVAIYDSTDYPEPVAHPAKSKSGWLWVLWVILLLGVGAGGALLMYNLGIIP